MKKALLCVMMIIAFSSCNKSTSPKGEVNAYGTPVDLVLFDVHGPVKSITYENGFLDQYALPELHAIVIQRSETFDFSEDGIWNEKIEPLTTLYNGFSYSQAIFDYKIIRENGCIVSIEGTPAKEQDGFDFNEFGLNINWDETKNIVRISRYNSDGSNLGDLIDFYTFLVGGREILFEYGNMPSKISKIQVLEQDNYDNWTCRKIVNVLNERSIIQRRNIEYYSAN